MYENQYFEIDVYPFWDDQAIAEIELSDENTAVKFPDFIRVIRESGTRGVISHHKSAGREHWGKVNTTLRLIDEACAEGVDLFCDVYPYVASSTSLSSRFIPKECCTGGNAGIVKLLSDPIERQKIKERNIRLRGWDQSMVLITVCAGYRQYEGKFLPEIAELHGKDVHETALDLICHSKNAVSACYFTMCEEDVETVLAHPRTMVCTDSSVRRNAAETVQRARCGGFLSFSAMCDRLPVGASVRLSVRPVCILGG